MSSSFIYSENRFFDFLFGTHDLNDPYETEKIAVSLRRIDIHNGWNPFNTNYDAEIAILEL